MNYVKLAGLLVSLGVAACSSSSSGGSTPVPDASTPSGSDGGVDANTPATDGGLDAGATTTIAQARAGNVTTPITVVAVVTGLHGSPGDYSQWYIEDPAGGPNSGVAVYCDPDLSSCPTLRAPALNSLVAITGSLSTYKNDLQFVPTAQTVLQANASPPPIATVTAADIAEGATSPYRGVLVQLSAKLTVDDATPAALYDSKCNVATDGGTDGGLPLCAGCEPPTYSGFQANDGAGNEIYIEDFFFYTCHLQSSPECSSGMGEIAVTAGMTFSSITGILDYDPYGKAQALYPVADSDYVTP